MWLDSRRDFLSRRWGARGQVKRLPPPTRPGQPHGHRSGNRPGSQDAGKGDGVGEGPLQPQGLTTWSEGLGSPGR